VGRTDAFAPHEVFEPVGRTDVFEQRAVFERGGFFASRVVFDREDRTRAYESCLVY
jgi:hypothetical protein